MVALGGHVWLVPGGVCVVGPGGMCMVALGGHAWLFPGCVCGCSRGACMVAPGGGVHGCS